VAVIRKACLPATRAKKQNLTNNFLQHVEEQELQLLPEVLADWLALKEHTWASGTIQGASSHIVRELRHRRLVNWDGDPFITDLVSAMTKLHPKTSRYERMFDISIIYEHLAQHPPRTGHHKDHRRHAVILVRASTCLRATDTIGMSRTSQRLICFGANCVRPNPFDFQQTVWSKPFTECTNAIFEAAFASPAYYAVEFQLRSWKQKRQTGQGGKLSKPHRLLLLDTDKRNICAASALINYYKLNKNRYTTCDHDFIWTAYNTSRPIVSPGTILQDTLDIMTAAGVEPEYRGNAIRHAAISKWHSIGVSRELVAQRTLHRSEDVISQFYDKSATHDISTLVTQPKTPSRSWAHDAAASILAWFSPGTA